MLLIVLSILTGIIYPLVMTGIAQTIFPKQANGSLIYRDGKPVGSSLIGQPFTDPKYFWSRPSATSPMPYNAESSAGSNLGPMNPDLATAVQERIAALRKADPGNDAPIPVDLVTSSASGLDPHISPAAAEYQIARVAKARGLDVAAVRQLVARHTEGRTLGLLGEPRVNVVELNLDLDRGGVRTETEIPGARTKRNSEECSWRYVTRYDCPPSPDWHAGNLTESDANELTIEHPRRQRQSRKTSPSTRSEDVRRFLLEHRPSAFANAVTSNVILLRTSERTTAMLATVRYSAMSGIPSRIERDTDRLATCCGHVMVPTWTQHPPYACRINGASCPRD